MLESQHCESSEVVRTCETSRKHKNYVDLILVASESMTSFSSCFNHKFQKLLHWQLLNIQPNLFEYSSDWYSRGYRTST